VLLSWASEQGWIMFWAGQHEARPPTRGRLLQRISMVSTKPGSPLRRRTICTSLRSMSRVTRLMTCGASLNSGLLQRHG